MKCDRCGHPQHAGVCDYPLVEEVWSNGMFGLPASLIPYDTEIVGTCHCGTPYTIETVPVLFKPLPPNHFGRHSLHLNWAYVSLPEGGGFKVNLHGGAFGQ